MVDRCGGPDCRNADSRATERSHPLGPIRREALSHFLADGRIKIDPYTS